MVARVAAERPWITCGGKRVASGLYPKKAAKSAPVGGKLAAARAAPAGIPACARPLNRADGRLAANPSVTTVKIKVILRVLAVFWKVARIPEAAPRFSGGTEFMIAVVLGAANMPMPIPINKMIRAKGK